MGGSIAVTPDPVCIGDAITFTLSGVVDEGGIKRVDCNAKTEVPAVTPTYTWIITKPDASTVNGSGEVATVVADDAGTYSCTFTASASRECAPSDITIGPENKTLTFSATITADPTSIPARSQWQTILPWAASEIAVTWQPPECEGTLDIVEVVGDAGYVPPDVGTVEPLEPPTKWIYRAFLERQTELCPKPANVKIAAMQGDTELNRVSVRVSPIHDWLTNSHQHGPGAPQHPPDNADFWLDFEYLSWKHGGVLATTGGEFTSVIISTDPQVVCPRFPGDWDPPIGYACTTGTEVVFGTLTFAGSENQAASIIGHELLHTVDDPLAGECPAYQWEWDYRFGTGTNPCDADYLQNVREYLDDPNNGCQ